ncbi:stage II sporulation protein P [Cohnella massiliensis]|uniref:stage II sporulation protein P n=1 Tax=Cohnella massiliensis TaxID=1816691 RepID=UPI0009BB599C|nr:stage II sporulation protein P [Cohnella massiliensis]
MNRISFHRGLFLVVFAASFFSTILVFSINHHASIPMAKASGISVSIVPAEGSPIDGKESFAPKNEEVKVELAKNISTSISNPAIFIYHTHNRESWLPELANIQNADQAFDPNINVTLLGTRLAENLKKYGIEVVHSTEDYVSEVKSFNYAQSYQYSKLSVKEAMTRNNGIRFLFDLHRDSQPREETTVTFNNRNYAQVYFVIGTNNPNWKQNMKFAEQLQEGLNTLVPQLSKGIYRKDKSSGNGEYNQSFSGTSALIEIGGVGNTLEESYRTIDLLSKVIRQVWKENTEQPLLASNL